MIRIPIPDPIDYLAHRKFPLYRSLVDYVPFTGQKLGRIPPEKRREMLAEIEAFKADLESRPADEVRALYETEQAKERAEKLAKADLEERLRFFNRPGAGADFVHWSKAAHWTLDEAVALSFGKAPEVVAWENVKPYEHVSPFAAKYKRVRDLALRAKVWNQLYDPVLPSIFLAWARRCEIEFPPELLAQIEKRGTLVADWKDLYEKVKGHYDELLTTHNLEISKANATLTEYRERREELIRENALLKAQAAESEATRWDGFDPDSSNYPPELDICMQAWRGVTNGPDTPGTAKEQIERWLDTHYQDRRALSSDARQRIAVICNWEKGGGRPRREDK